MEAAATSSSASAAAAAGAGSAAAGTTKRSPSEFLKSVIGRPVQVRLTTGSDYRGVTAGMGKEGVLQAPSRTPGTLLQGKPGLLFETVIHRS